MNNKLSHPPKGIALLLIGLSLTLTVVLIALHTAHAAGVHYAAPAAQGSADCTSWDNACTLPTALAGSASGDEIWVQAGVHYPGSVISDTFTLQSGVALYGGFAGVETAREQRDWTANLTVLSGDIDQNDITDPTGVVTNTAHITGTNAYHVVTSVGVTETAVLDGFVITAGQANGVSPNDDGGGMNNSGSPTLTNITFSGNLADYDGGGMSNKSGSPTLTNVTFSGNSANRYGGGMFNLFSNPTLTNVTFSSHSAYSGGGMFNSSSSPTLTNVAFSSNSADFGGGMHNNGYSSPTLTNVTFSGNSAHQSGGGMRTDGYSSPTLTTVNFSSNSAGEDGGGMFNQDSSPTLTDVTFIGNMAVQGGGMFNVECDPVLTNVTFNGNMGTLGGGMHNWASSTTLTNVVFSGNGASVNGGGMDNSYGSLTLTNVTFHGNSAHDSGGGMSNWFIYLTLTHITFSGNSAYDGGGMYNNGDVSTLTNVVFSNNSAEQNGGGMATRIHYPGNNQTLTNVTFSENSANFGGGMYNWDNDPTLTNVILWGNSAPNGAGIYNDGSSAPQISYSDIQGCGGSSSWDSVCGADGGGNIEADPLFVDAPNGNLRLQDASPAINAGDNAVLPPGLLTDLDGNPRIVRVFVDMGAYENQTFPCPVGGMLYVDQDATGDQTGESWEDAMTTLQDVLQFTEACEIWVAEGIYYPDEGGSQADDDRAATFQLKSGVAIYGGFAGTETSREQRDWATHLTVLSGDIDQNDLTDPNGIVTDTANIIGNNAYHVVRSNSVTKTAVLDGFTVTAGLANGSYPHYYSGGGMFNYSSSSPTLANVTFSGNGSSEGGGMSNWIGSSPALTNVNLSGNTALGGSGGGVYNYLNSNPTLTNVTFSSNIANQSGGGMYNYNSSPKLTNVTFSGNIAGGGGGMSNWGSSPTLTNVTFSSNLGGNGGGGMYNYLNSNPTLTNVTINGNSAGWGGGMLNSESSPTLTNVILWGNSAPNNGAGIWNDNSAPQISTSDIQGCGGSGSWDSACGVNGGGNIEADPLFVDAATGNLRLQDNSPAIDAGNNAALPPDTLTDLEGNPRFVDIPTVPDTGSGAGPIVDMGAYEVQYVNVVYVSLATAGSVNGLSVADEDVIGYDIGRDLWYLVFDGSDVGLGSADVDAFSLRPDGSLLLSLDIPLVVGDLGTVDDSDILRFIPTSLGMATAGTFEPFWDGSAYDLTDDSEDVDALAFAPDGRLLVSTIGKLTVAGLKAQDEDLSALNLTTGTWSLYFDGSDVGLAEANSEDVYGAAVNGATGNIYLTTRGVFDVPGVGGDGADILLCTSASLGNTTSCAYTLFWDGSARGLAGETLDALEVGFSTGPMLWASAQTQQAAGGLTFNDEDIFAYDPMMGIYAMVFDGLDVGITGDVDAFSRLADGSLLLSLDAATDVADLGTVDDSDILRFIPTALGLTTAGTFELYLDGSAYGLTEDGEDIDALAFAPDGRLLVSTLGNLTVNCFCQSKSDPFGRRKMTHFG